MTVFHGNLPAAVTSLDAAGYGVFNCAGCVARGVVAAMAGALKQAIGLGAAFQIAAPLLLVSGGLLLGLRRELH